MYEDLARAVVKQALKDLGWKKYRKEAWEWVMEPHRACRMWCEVGGLDVEVVQKRAKEVWDGGG